MARGSNKKVFGSNKKTPKYNGGKGYKDQLTQLQTQANKLAGKLSKTTDPTIRKTLQKQIKSINKQINKFLRADIRVQNKQAKAQAAITNAAENTRRTKYATLSAAATTAPSGVAKVIDSTNTATVASGRDDSSAKGSDDEKLSYEDLINSLGGFN